MAYDGTIKIGTELDTKGLEAGMKKLEKIVSSSAITRALGSVNDAASSSSDGIKQFIDDLGNFFNTASNIGKVITTFRDVQSAISGVATGVGGAFNLAGIAATALISALSILAENLNNTYGNVETVRASIEKTRASVDAINTSFDENVASTESSAIAANRLIGELEQLEGKGALNADDQARYADIVAQLNIIIPELNAIIDKQTGLVIGGTAALRNNVSAWRDVALEQAYLEKNADLVTEWANSMYDAGNARTKLNGIKDRYDTTMQKISKITRKSVEELQGLIQESGLVGEAFARLAGAGEDTAFEVQVLAQDVFNLFIEMEALNGIIGESENLTAELDTQLANDEAAKKANADATKENTDANKEGAEQTGVYSERVLELAAAYGTSKDALAAMEANGTLEEWAARQEGALQRLEEKYNTFVDATSNMFSGLEQVKPLEFDAISGNLDERNAATQKWIEQMEILKGKAQEMDFIQPLVDKLSETGPEWANQLEVFAQMSEEQLSSLMARIDLGELFSYEATSLIDAFANADTNPAQAILEQQLTTFAEDTTVPDAAVDVVDRAYNAATLRVPEVDFSTIGLNMMRGIENGIRSGTAGILTAMNEAIAKAHAAAQDIDEQHSPSQWWEKFGLNDMEGFALGIDEGAKLVQMAQANMLGSLHAKAAMAYMPSNSPGNGGGNTYTQIINTHDSLSPHELTQEFSAFKAREGWQLA